MYGHCLVKLNTTHALLTGGYSSSGGYLSSSYLYSEHSGFVKQADMTHARRYHGCALHSDGLVFVTGGYGSSGGMKTTEYFSLSTLTWLPGPDLPVSKYAGKMLAVDGKTFFIGGARNKKIFQLESLAELSTTAWRRWVEVGELHTERYHFDVVKMDEEDCKKWNN